MLKVGLTGGIASGKSVVGEMLVALGAHLVQADRIAHDLMLPGQPVYHEVVAHFGRGILNADRSVNRAKLAEAAFGSPRPTVVSHRRTQPYCASSGDSRQDKWMEEIGRQDCNAIAIVEAALIFEARAADHFDRLIVVTCKRRATHPRFAARQKLGLEAARKEVARRMAAQFPESEKIKAADYVIDNSGSLDQTRKQVEQVWSKLTSVR